jgi:hypothetical protein
MINLELNFESFFEEKIIKEQEKLTLIIGSGFHKQAFLNKENVINILTNWCCLLRSINPKIELSKNYLLDFEREILNKTSIQDALNASKIEREILKDTAKKIKEIQLETLKSLSDKYPYEILNPKYVSDIISLNFDTIAEELFKKNHKKFRKKPKSEYQSKQNKQLSNSLYYNEYFFNEESIRFWYPHGSINRPTSLILSARNYGTHITCIESLRRKMKLNETNDATEYNIPRKNQTWFSQLVHSNVLILGAQISDSELDIWYAFINRERNFGKKSNNKQYRSPIFQMRNNTNADKNLANSNEIWFNPLFNEDYTYDVQWNKLSKLFNQKV